VYNPHAKDQVDFIDEAAIMSKGRLVKVRLEDKPVPNVSWFWIKVGNCHSCKYMTLEPRCSNSKISDAQFFDEYVYTNTCPQFSAGVDMQKAADNSGQQDLLDVMKAIGLVQGKPSQTVKVIWDSLWSIDLAIRAHREQSIFLDMAHTADYVARGGKNDPSWMEYVDLSDDLERPAQAANSPAPPAP